MLKLQTREKQIFFIFGSLILFFLLQRGFLTPFLEKSKDVTQKLESQKRRLQKNLNTIKRNKHVTQQYNEIVDTFGQKGSDEKEMSAIIADVEAITKRMNLRFSEMKPQKVAEEEFFKVFSISLKLEGRIEQLTHFLYLLQNTPYFFRVDELRLDKKSQRNSLLNIHLVLSRVLIP